MKVFVVPTWHPTPNAPLWANWILPHISLLREYGIQAYVLQLGLDGEAVPEGEDPWRQPVRLIGENHLYVPVPQPTRSIQRTRFLYGNWLNRYAGRIRDLYAEATGRWGRPDLLHAHVSLPGGYVAAHLGAIENLPVIVQEHYTGFESDVRYPWRLAPFIREMGRKIDGFYAVSPGYAERIRKTNTISRVDVLPNPIDTDLFVPRGGRPRSDSFRIVTAGNMDTRKGTDILFEALRLLADELDWRLTLLGDTSRKPAFRRWLDDDRFAGRVRLAGRISQSDLVEVYSVSDLYVVSSRIETANVSMLQAMSCGIPVVTTSIGAPETLIDENVGIAVAPEDPRALAEGIMSAFRRRQSFDSETIRTFVVERYSKKVIGAKVVDIYKCLTGKSSVS